MSGQLPGDEQNEQDIFDLLRPLLQRAQCPSADELGDFHLEQVSSERQRWLADHLLHCQYCQQDLERLIQFLQTEAEEVSFMPTPADLLGESSALQALETSHSDQHFRGDDEEMRQLTFSIGAGTENATIFMALRRIEESLQLRGELILPLSFESLMNGAVIEIWQAQKVVAVTLVDDGAFVCHLPQYASFIFRLTAPGQIQFRHEVVL